MRQTSFTADLQKCETLKDLAPLIDEITKLLLTLLKVDKRSFKNINDKNIYKGRLDLYSRLYKQCREHYLALREKLQDFSNYHKEPLSIEDFIDKFTYDKSIKIVDDEDEDDFDDIPILSEKEKQKKSQETYTTLHNLTNEFIQELNNIMETQKKIFRRTDPEVVEQALKNSLKAFLSKFEGETSTVTLQRVYHELRAQHSKSTDPVIDRVGSDETSQPLEALSPVGADEVEVFEEIPTPETNPSDQEIREQFPANIEGSKEFKEAIESVEIDSKDLSSLSKDAVDSLIYGILQTNPDFKTASIKKELVSKGFENVTYDDVYYSFERVKKKLK